jgi:hypothetical protein
MMYDTALHWRQVAQTAAAQRRIHEIALGCLGLQPKDTVHIVPCLEHLHALARKMNIRCVSHPAMASVVIQDRPRETEVLSHLSRMRLGNRLLVFNDECDIETMPERCFELVTACIFDQESKRVLRVFDSYKPRRVDSYIDIELSEISDAAMTINASRIAALR